MEWRIKKKKKKKKKRKVMGREGVDVCSQQAKR